MRVELAAVAAGIFLVGCGSTAAPASSSGPTVVKSPAVMTKTEAAKRYMELTCPSNAASAPLTAALATYRNDSALGTPIPDDVRAAAKTYGEAAAAYAQGLKDPANVWPQDVAGMISEWAAQTYTQAAWADRMAAPNSTWEMTPRTSGDMPARIRLNLGLPPSGGC